MNPRERREGFAYEPIVKQGQLWWFWDYLWRDLIGPYESYLEAEWALTRYCSMLNSDGNKTP